MANAKDFVINFASDIIAVGTVLIITDFLIARDAAYHESRNEGMLSFVSGFASNLWNGVKEKVHRARNNNKKKRSTTTRTTTTSRRRSSGGNSSSGMMMMKMKKKRRRIPSS